MIEACQLIINGRGVGFWSQIFHGQATFGAKTNKKRTTYLLTPPIKEISDTITMALRTFYSLRNVFALVHY